MSSSHGIKLRTLSADRLVPAMSGRLRGDYMVDCMRGYILGQDIIDASGEP